MSAGCQEGGASKHDTPVRNFNDATSDVQSNMAALQSQREISSVQLIDGNIENSITIEVSPDGHCGFTATQHALQIAGVDHVAAKVSRRGFITSVRDEIAAFRDRADIDSNAESLNLLINIMKNNEARRASASRIESASAEDKLSWLERNVDAWSSDFKEWATDLHFEWMARVHDISYKVYIVDHADNTRFIPRPDGIIGIEKAGHPVVHLLHNSHVLVNIHHAGDPNTHFDLLFIAPTEETIRRIRSLELRITQDNTVEATPTVSTGGLFSRHGSQQQNTDPDGCNNKKVGALSK